MKLRSLALGAATAVSMIAIPAIANAQPGTATGSVNMRVCGSTQCQKIGVVPAGAQVWINGAQGGWYNVTFQGRQGFVSGRYIATGYAQIPQPRAYGGPPVYGGPYYIGPAPLYGYYQKPRLDRRYNAWYDGRRWYRNGIWFNDPSGFSFGFSFN